jgi:hypothetical protein
VPGAQDPKEPIAKEADTDDAKRDAKYDAVYEVPYAAVANPFHLIPEI